jgi:hypothetical protein
MQLSMNTRILRECLLGGLFLVPLLSQGAEYELQGQLRQTIINGMATLSNSVDFTVYVKDCNWLIRCLEKDQRGVVWQRELGMPNGIEIYETKIPFETNEIAPRKTAPEGRAFISHQTVPVELLDEGVIGHIWLMFASQCFWGTNTSGEITPVFNWHASVGAAPTIKASAEWELLNGPGSLPREVRYIGIWDETNALYTATSSTNLGNLFVPLSFHFEQAHAEHRRGMVITKQIDAKLTSVRLGCSRANFFPERGARKMVVVDWRLQENSSSPEIPGYMIAADENWPTVDQARRLLQKNNSSQSTSQETLSKPHQRFVLVVMIGLLLLGPLLLIKRKPDKGETS